MKQGTSFKNVLITVSGICTLIFFIFISYLFIRTGTPIDNLETSIIPPEPIPPEISQEKTIKQNESTLEEVEKDLLEEAPPAPKQEIVYRFEKDPQKIKLANQLVALADSYKVRTGSYSGVCTSDELTKNDGERLIRRIGNYKDGEVFYPPNLMYFAPSLGGAFHFTGAGRWGKVICFDKLLKGISEDTFAIYYGIAERTLGCIDSNKNYVINVPSAKIHPSLILESRGLRGNGRPIASNSDGVCK